MSNTSHVSAAALSSQDFHRFREFLQKACGILLGENKQYLVNSRLRHIMAEHQIEGLGQLVAQMQRPASRALREAVIDAMTTNETLWFRDSHPFRLLGDKLLPELHDSLKGRPAKIWSAACSTGQEPYSIAMVADAKRRAGKSVPNVSVTATDISQTVLDAARQGEYEMLAIGRGLPTEYLNHYFQEQKTGTWQLSDTIKRAVQFRVLNLLDSYSALGKFDIIFCRNVLIYFSAELKRDILTRMHQCLNPGGYLFLGSSEAVNGMQDHYHMVNFSPGIAYQKR